MILSFKQKFQNGKPTFFVPKIWKGLNLGIGDYQLDFPTRHEGLAACFKNGCTNKEEMKFVKPKIHSIREDKTGRWK